MLTFEAMTTVKLTSIESEFDSVEEATSYNQWFTAKVQASLRLADDPSTPRYSSDEVMRHIDATIAATQAKYAARRVA